MLEELVDNIMLFIIFIRVILCVNLPGSGL